MKRFAIFALFLFVLAADAAAQTGGKSAEQEFLSLQRAEDEAEAKKDVAALDRLFSDDFVFVAANGAFYDKKKFLDEIKADTEPSAPQKLEYENFRARVYGKTAIVNYVLVVPGKDSAGKDVTNRFQMSVLWTKQKGKWRISNFHATRVRV